jgi:glycosyltransferase involved in cell wall biosynthesis
MKLLMLNSEYPPLGGGQGNANKHLFEVFNRQKDMDIAIDMVVASTDTFRKEAYHKGQIYFLDIGKKNRNLHFQSAFDLIQYTLKVFFYSITLIKQNRYNLIVAWAGVPAGFVAFLLNILFNIPYIVLLRGADVPFWDPRWQRLDRLVLCRLSPYIWKRAGGVYANSDGLRALAQRVWPKGAVGVIYNGVDTELFAPSASQSTVNKRVVILSVGRLIPRKGFHDMIEALGDLKRFDFEVWIVGEGPERERLTALAASKGLTERVRFFGIKPQAELAMLYRQADIYCLPTLNEGMSNTVLESMACGLPVVTTNVSGNSELVTDNGFVVQPGDKNALRDGLARLLSDIELQKSMGRMSRDRAKMFSWDNVVRQFYQAFLNAVKSDKT